MESDQPCGVVMVMDHGCNYRLGEGGGRRIEGEVGGDRGYRRVLFIVLLFKGTRARAWCADE